MSMSVQPQGDHVDLSPYAQIAGKMSGDAVLALGKLIDNEVKFNKSREQKGESLPTGTPSFMFSFENESNMVISGVIRAKHLYEKVVIKNVDELIQKLTGPKKIAFGLVLSGVVNSVQEQNEAFRRCLAACDPVVADQPANSLLVKSAVYFIVTKSK